MLRCRLCLYSIENEMLVLLVAVNICTSTKHNGIDNTSIEDINNIKYVFEEQIEWAKDMNGDFIMAKHMIFTMEHHM